MGAEGIVGASAEAETLLGGSRSDQLGMAPVGGCAEAQPGVDQILGVGKGRVLNPRAALTIRTGRRECGFEPGAQRQGRVGRIGDFGAIELRLDLAETAIVKDALANAD
jgi:hypothetical protein